LGICICDLQEFLNPVRLDVKLNDQAETEVTTGADE